MIWQIHNLYLLPFHGGISSPWRQTCSKDNYPQFASRYQWLWNSDQTMSLFRNHIQRILQQKFRFLCLYPKTSALNHQFCQILFFVFNILKCYIKINILWIDILIFGVILQITLVARIWQYLKLKLKQNRYRSIQTEDIKLKTIIQWKM